MAELVESNGAGHQSMTVSKECACWLIDWRLARKPFERTARTRINAPMEFVEGRLLGF